MSGSSSNVVARASLAVRIVIGAIAVLALTAGVLASVNLRAASEFNQATQHLNEQIASAKEQTPDYNKLSILQDQTDAQFRDAAAASMVLLPGLREAIAANAAVSAELTRYVKAQLTAQEEQSDDPQQSSGASSSDSSESSESSGAGTPSQGGLTDEQRRKVEELLKANEQSTPSDSGTTDDNQSQTTNNTGNTSKPW